MAKIALFSISKKLEFIELTIEPDDWWDELSEVAKKEIEEGIQQADNGNLIEHKEARKIFCALPN